MNVPVAFPGAMITDVGVIKAVLLLETATVAPPVVETVTVQFAVTALLRVAGVHRTAVIVEAALSVTVADCDDPFSNAVIVAVSSEVIVPGVAMNVVVVAPEAMDTEEGTVSAALLLKSSTIPPADFETVTVQVLDPLPTGVNGVQLNAVTVTGAPSVIIAVFVDPFKDAVTVATASLAIVPALAVNVAVVAPLATVTEAGTLNAP